ncbi:XkdX family protein [Staphylococcus pseudintermedius]|nr:XkdX family protein [Staphylococcus pseudintermedius]WQC59898.1 XkdX family protein [Staphylococcus pseudintermedius]
MKNIGIKYYKMGLYTEKQFALFVKRGFVTEEEFKRINRAKLSRSNEPRNNLIFSV